MLHVLVQWSTIKHYFTKI